MTDDDVAAGMFKLAKAHRRNAHNMRVRANTLVRAANRGRSGGLWSQRNAQNAALEIRVRAAKEDMKAAFLARGAALAKFGAVSFRWHGTPLALAASRPGIRERIGAVLASVAMGIIAPKPKGKKK